MVLWRVFVCLPFGVLAQCASDTDNVSINRWSFGVELETNCSYRELIFTQSIGQNQSRYEYMQKLNNEELPFYGYQMGATIQRKCGRRISLLFGIGFAQFSFRSIAYDTLHYAPLGFDPVSGPSMWYLLDARYIWSGSYFNLPIAVRYAVGVRKLSFVSDLGISFGLFNQKEVVVNSTAKEQVTNTFVKGNEQATCAINVGAGLGYAVGKRYTLLLQPHFTYTVTSLQVIFAIKRHAYSLGMNCSLYYNMK